MLIGLWAVGEGSVRDCNSLELGGFNLIEYVQRKNLVVGLDSRDSGNFEDGE